ncbi:MAG: protein-glutamate O-methyltransferase CheR [Spirochaetales bacterium]|nr:protein-glutamate O-methyltransferase CheR [Spirochaetales bacterium]
MSSITTSKLTRFFRNQSHFKALEYFVIPAIIEKKLIEGDRTMRIWSAGCSTGEEPYSIAMLCLDLLPPGFELEVTATDEDSHLLIEARNGAYPESRVEDVPHRYLKEYFGPIPGGYSVTGKLKEAVTFECRNLKDPTALRDRDVVFCRNVLIYMDQAARKSVLASLREAMNVGSYLFTGDAESLLGVDASLESVKTAWTTLYRKVRV